ncbi:reverse transcriptase domain-containing protein [Tanacetum coccineum]
MHKEELFTKAEQAFGEIKQQIVELPMLTAPKPKEEVIIYLSATREPGNQLQSMEKLILALVHATRRLRRFEFDASNDEAKYLALIARLRIAEQMGIKNLSAKVDSRLVANQINGSYIAKEQSMIQYLEKARALINNFKMFSIEQVPRSENKKADALSKIASTSFAHLTKQVLVEILKEKSICEKEILAVVKEEGYTWMTLLFEYLTKETLPTEVKKARTVKIKSKQYADRWCLVQIIIYETVAPMYRTTPSRLRGKRDSRRIMQHVLRTKISKSTIRYPRTPNRILPQSLLNDPSTNKALTSQARNQVKKFVLDNIVCRFGLPGEIVSDNEKQFTDKPFRKWCEKLNINQRFTSIEHPQTNGIVERTNRSLGEGIKAILDAGSKDWIEEVPHVLWAHRMMIKSSNRDTPFSLTYGMEVMIPIMVEENRESTAIREAKSKAKMEKYYNAKVHNTSFKPSDFVYRNNDASHAEDTRKLGPKWEGLYEVVESLRKGAYKLRMLYLAFSYKHSPLL